MHCIEPEDIALGTVERHENEPVSWHGLEKPRAEMTTENCGLRAMKIRRAAVTVALDEIIYPASLIVPCVPHPMPDNEGKLLFLGKPFEPETYELFDNDEFLNLAAECFKAAGLDNSIAFTTTLNAGRRATLAKRIPEADFKDATGHEIATYFNLLNSFDGSWQLFANVSEIRTVCYNTATANIAEGGFTVRHRPEAIAQFVANFPQLFAAAVETHKGSANDYLMMGNEGMTQADATAFFAALLCKGERLSTRSANLANEELLSLFVRGKGNYGKTRADAYNAITEYYTHNGTAEANAPGGTSDNRKREAKALLLSDKLNVEIERGRKLLADYIASK